MHTSLLVPGKSYENDLIEQNIHRTAYLIAKLTHRSTQNLGQNRGDLCAKNQTTYRHCQRSSPAGRVN